MSSDNGSGDDDSRAQHGGEAKGKTLDTVLYAAQDISARVHQAAEKASSTVQEVGSKAVGVVTSQLRTIVESSLEAMTGGSREDRDEAREIKQAHLQALHRFNHERDLHKGDLALDKITSSYLANGADSCPPQPQSNTTADEGGDSSLFSDIPSRTQPTMLRDTMQAPTPTFGGPPLPADNPGNNLLTDVEAASIPTYGGPPMPKAGTTTDPYGNNNSVGGDATEGEVVVVQSISAVVEAPFPSQPTLEPPRSLDAGQGFSYCDSPAANPTNTAPMSAGNKDEECKDEADGGECSPFTQSLANVAEAPFIEPAPTHSGEPNGSSASGHQQPFNPLTSARSKL